MYKQLKILVLTILLSMAFLPAAFAAESSTNSKFTEVQVSGSYQEELAPDIAYINLGTVTEAETIAVAQSKNAELSNRIRQQIEKLGIKGDYIKTAQYAVTPLYKNDDSGRRLPEIKGYQVTNSITVTADPAKAGEIIDTALKAGANQVNNIRFAKKTETEAKNSALTKAVQDAMSKAEAIADALNKRVVKVKAVQENGINLQSPETAVRYYAKAADLAPATPISAGLMTLTANVQVVVELE